MAYDKHVWTCGEAITTEKLNHMEDGIAEGGGGGKAFTDVGEGTCGDDTYIEYNITYNDFINARNNSTNIVYALTDADELQARNIVAFNCIERSGGYYEVQAIYASVIEDTPLPTVNWMQLTLFCDTTGGYMRDVNCWDLPN